MVGRLRQWARELKRDVVALWLATGDPRVPFVAKLVAAATAAYALSPIDLIPDFIPVLGLLDDLMLLPAGPGALLGGWLGEHVDLRAALAFAGVGSLLVAGWAWHNPVVRGVRTLPSPAALPQGVGDKVGAAPPPAAGLAEPDVSKGAAKSGPPRP